ncbi:MAG: sulfotransferase [Steroidobacteraceae bacterium]
MTSAPTIEPGSWQDWEKLGEQNVQSRRFDVAESHFARAAALRPNDPSLLFKWARASFDNGNIEETLRVLGPAARLAPGHPAILRLFADVFESRGAWHDLERVAADWTRMHPKSAQAWRSLSKAQWESGYSQLAAQNFRTSLDLGGRDADGLATLGRIRLHALDLEGAATALDEAEALDPRHCGMLSAKAMLLMWNGNYDEAQAYCRRAIRANPADVAAYKTLTALTKGRLTGDEMSALRAITEDGELRITERATALFVLADCLDAEDRIGEAFACYERANGLATERAQAEGLMYEPVVTAQQTRELISLFERVPTVSAKPTDPRPIFIIGMPRSGTTLIESVIAAHSRVVAGGERAGIRRILPEYLALVRSGAASAIPDGKWAEWRTFYMRDVPVSPGIEAITDKNPWNFDALGLILGLFPGASIIHIRRNPVETGFSIFRNEFSKLVRCTHRLTDIGHFHGEYARVMAHWERVAGDRFTTIQYDDFVQQFEVAAPALLAACGLGWEEDCGRFWNNKRAISTLSTMQARRPIGAPAARAQAYAPYLEPLVTALLDAGVDLRTGKHAHS